MRKCDKVKGVVACCISQNISKCKKAIFTNANAAGSLGRDRDRDRDRDVEEGEIQGEVGIVMEEEKVKTRKGCRDVEGEGSEI